MAAPRSRSPRSHASTRRFVAIGWAVLLALTPVWPAASASAAIPGPTTEEAYTGRSLEEVLTLLADGGLRIVFSSGVVRPDMRVSVEPRSAEPRAVLDEVLRPFGLAAVPGPGETIIVVRAEEVDRPSSSLAGVVRARGTREPLADATVRVSASGVEVATDEGGSFEIDVPSTGTVMLEVRAPGYLEERFELTGHLGAVVDIELERLPLITEQLVVSPSRVSLLHEAPAAPLGLDRDDIAGLPHLGGDFYRALTLLPGTTANDVSVRFHVRGGRSDETQVLLDGQELYEAYHLKDYDSALSLVAEATIASADLSTGGFPVRYGDRMSGVLDMTTVTPATEPRFRAGLGVLAAQVGGHGVTAGERGRWLFDLRRGSGVLVDRVLRDGNPEFWDAFAKSEWQLGSAQSLRFNLLGSGEELDFEETVDGEEKRFETEYASAYLWLTHQAISGSRLVVDSGVSLTRLDRERRGFESEEDGEFAIVDARDTDVVELRQDWSAALGSRHSLAWGGSWRRFETAYDYLGTREFDNPLARIRHDAGLGSTRLVAPFSDRHASLYLTDRLRLERGLTLELGARWDRHSLVGSDHLSPRLNLAWQLGERTVARAAWGRFRQSQRTYELQVEDGETSFAAVERAEQRVLGLESLLGADSSSGVTLRVELYEREVANPRPRFENLYEPLNVFPEVEPDRVRTAPERSRARGLEVFARGRFSPRVGWWASYTLAATEDRLGDEWLPRPFDETHSLSLDLDWRLPRDWRLNLAWRYHTGWPTTPLSLASGVDDEGETIWLPVLGRRNSRRLPDYHRLDLRVSRGWRRERLTFGVFFDVQNLYDRGNLGGFDFEIDDEVGELVRVGEEWAGLLPSAGFSVEF